VGFEVPLFSESGVAELPKVSVEQLLPQPRAFALLEPPWLASAQLVAILVREAEVVPISLAQRIWVRPRVNTLRSAAQSHAQPALLPALALWELLLRLLVAQG